MSHAAASAWVGDLVQRHLDAMPVLLFIENHLQRQRAVVQQPVEFFEAVVDQLADGCRDSEVTGGKFEAHRSPQRAGA